MIRALLVGSQVNWKPKLEAVLAEHGIQVDWWWESKSDLGHIPDACDLVLITTDHNSHTLSVPAADRARFAGIKLIHITHRRAQLVPSLIKCGFPCLLSPVPLPLPEITMHPPVPAPSTPPAPSSLVVHGAKYHTLRGTVERDRYTVMIRLLAAEPMATASIIGSRLRITPAMVEHVVAAARETLGISGGRVSNSARYEAACQALGVPAADVREPPAKSPETPVAPVLPVPPVTVDTSAEPSTDDCPHYVGRDVSDCRTQLGESQMMFSKRMGCSQTVVSVLERTPLILLSNPLRRALHDIMMQTSLERQTAVSRPLPTLPARNLTLPAESMFADLTELNAKLQEARAAYAHQIEENKSIKEQMARQVSTPVKPTPAGWSNTEMPDVRTALGLLREAMRAERIETMIVNESDCDKEIPCQILAAGTSALTRLAIVSETWKA